MIVRILLLFIALFTFGAQAQAIKESYAFAVLGEPRYAFNFNHLICEPRRAKRWANNVVCPRHLR